MSFTPGLVLDCQDRPMTGGETWRALSEEFWRQIEDPELVQLVVTDRYEHAGQVWQRQTPPEYGDQGAVDVYFASKIDGTQAAAKTVVLSGGRSVVIAAVGTLALGSDVVRWMLTHEAQHVRLHQLGRAAWGVHRRSGQEIVSPRPWVFVWSAQNAIDEYRCEQAVHAQLARMEPAYGPAELEVVYRHLGSAQRTGTVRGDLEHAYQIVAQAIDRLAVLAAYSAAAVESGRDPRRRWDGAPELTGVWEALWAVPAVGSPTDSGALWANALQVSETLDLLLRGAGVELTFVDDQLALYFT